MLKSLVGISHAELDCWGLCVKYYKEVRGLELKHYYNSRPKDRDETMSLIYTCKGDFQKVDVPQEGDILLVKDRGVESHIMIYLGRGKVLHSTHKTGSVIDRFSRWSKLVSGIYRPKTLGGNNG